MITKEENAQRAHMLATARVGECASWRTRISACAQACLVSADVQHMYM